MPDQIAIDNYKKEAFLISRKALAWAFRAMRHMRAADILYDVAHAADQRRWDRFIKSVETGASRPGKRYLEGEELEDANDADLMQDYCLLAGYALECAFKGYLIALLPELVSEDRGLDKLLRNHDLCDLARECAIPLSSEEQALLATLTQVVIWGKYPAHTHWKEMPCPFRDSEEPHAWRPKYGGSVTDRPTQNLIHRVYERAMDSLYLERASMPNCHELIRRWAEEETGPGTAPEN